METKEEPKEEIKVETITLGPDLVKNDHYFRLQRGRDNRLEAQCTSCPLGFHIGEEHLKDGHIYIKDKLVI